MGRHRPRRRHHDLRHRPAHPERGCAGGRSRAHPWSRGGRHDPSSGPTAHFPESSVADADGRSAVASDARPPLIRCAKGSSRRARPRGGRPRRDGLRDVHGDGDVAGAARVGTRLVPGDQRPTGLAVRHHLAVHAVRRVRHHPHRCGGRRRSSTAATRRLAGCQRPSPRPRRRNGDGSGHWVRGDLLMYNFETVGL